MKRRYIWIDILNIAAIVSVVMLHVSTAETDNPSLYNGHFVWSKFIHSFLIWPVDVFYMLTGCNLIGRIGGLYNKYALNRIKKAVIPFFIWSLIYYFLRSRTQDPIEFLNLLLTGTFVVYMWFFIPLFAIYICLPFLEKIIINSEWRLIECFIIISFLLNSCFPFFLERYGIHCPKLFPIGSGYLCFPIYGYYLNKYPLSLNKRKIIYIMGVLGAIIIFLMQLWLSISSGINDRTYMDYLSPFCILLATAVFVFFKYTNWNSLEKYSNYISFVSSCTLGVYLVHYIVIAILRYMNYICSEHYFSFVIVYIISLFVILIFKKIPYIKNIVP